MQQTLISQEQKPKKETQPVRETSKEVTKSLEFNNTPVWNKINDWLENCKQQKDNFAYFTVEYRANVHLDSSKEEYVTTSTTLERPFRREDDSYGGCWGGGGTYGKDNLERFKNDIVGWRKNLLEAPYCKEKADGTALRDIKAENIRVFIEDRAKDFINRVANWNTNDLIAELKAIKEAPLTDEILKKFERMKFLDKEIHKVEYDNLPELKDKTLKTFDDNENAQTVLDGEKFDLNAVHKLYQRLKSKLAQMEKEYDELRHELYRWDK